MKKNQWILLIIAFVLIGGTALALTWLKKNQRLGKPGIKATPVQGSVAMHIDLPERVLNFTSTNIPEPDVVLGYLPGDTSYAQRYYKSSDGFEAAATVILMGADRTSIHRPEYCMPGQGWTIHSKTEEKIHIGGEHPYDLPVMKWIISNTIQNADGKTQEVSGLFVFWLVADNEQSTSNVRFQLYLFRDLLTRGILQRWAYINFFTVCTPGQEDATFDRLKKLIAASVPEFQLPPHSAIRSGK